MTARSLVLAVLRPLRLPGSANAVLQHVWQQSRYHAVQHFSGSAPGEDTLYSSSCSPAHYTHPSVKVSHIPGQGRGLVASAPLQQGDPVFISQPLAIQQGPLDQMPDPDLLIPLLTSIHQPVALQWLSLLHKGTKSAARPRSSAQEIQILQTLLEQPTPVPDTPGQHVSQTPGSAAAPQQPAPLTPQEAEQVVAYNAFGDGFEDLAVAQLRAANQGQPASTAATDPESDITATARSHVGVWPHFSLFNHSCVPSCIHYVMGTNMVVRAVRAVAAGEQLTVSYLGREDFSPVHWRRKLLQERYGFICQCPRCQLESRLPRKLQHLLVQLWGDTASIMQPDFTRAVDSEDRAVITQMDSVLTKWARSLHDAVAEFRQKLDMSPSLQPPAADQQLLQHAVSEVAAGSQPQPASDQQPAAPSNPLQQAVTAVGGVDTAVLVALAPVFDFVELLHQHAQVAHAYRQAKQPGTAVDSAHEDQEDGGLPGFGALKLATDIVHAVSRGSELHVFQTCRLLELAMDGSTGNLLGPTASVDEAEAVEEALRCRYGHISPELMVKLAKINAAISHQFVV